MILLDHTLPHTLIPDWQFYIAAITLVAAITVTLVKHLIDYNILKVKMANQDEKFTARINTLKETFDKESKGVKINHSKLYTLCEQMNGRLARIEGKLDKNNK